MHEAFTWDMKSGSDCDNFWLGLGLRRSPVLLGAQHVASAHLEQPAGQQM